MPTHLRSFVQDEGGTTVAGTADDFLHMTQEITFRFAEPFAFTTPVTGSHRLYPVFRSVEGGPAAGFGNLDRVGFRGPGIGVTP
jgi:hypothetical protein